MTARPATGNMMDWKIAQPAERGSFIHILFEQDGKVWVADMGHEKGKDGHFGVVTEVKAAKFEVRNGRVVGHVKTDGEQVFTNDHFEIDLTFDAALEN